MDKADRCWEAATAGAAQGLYLEDAQEMALQSRGPATPWGQKGSWNLGVQTSGVETRPRTTAHLLGFTPCGDWLHLLWGCERAHTC